MRNNTKFLPSFVGSKAYWLTNEHLKRVCSNQYIVELFCGSAMITAAYAKKALLNDIDPYLYKIYTNYSDLIVPNVFTAEDYFKYRKNKEWWKYIYCLQKMSFSGVFRYSKNGYNVPIKSSLKNSLITVKYEYEKSKKRFLDINPTITNLSYHEVYIPNLSDAVIILDPPYENSKANYNNNKFDYHYYWQYVSKIKDSCKSLIIFDSEKNMPFKGYQIRKMRVNGKQKGDREAMYIHENKKNVAHFEQDLKFGKSAEQEFYEIFKEVFGLKKEDGLKKDFTDSNGDGIELKTDRYDMEKTSNFFIERYSYGRNLGGPWQAIKNGNKYFCYWFYKNGTVFFFKLDEMIERLDNIKSKYDLIPIRNENHITMGYKIPRKELLDICKIFKTKEQNQKKPQDKNNNDILIF